MLYDPDAERRRRRKRDRRVGAFDHDATVGDSQREQAVRAREGAGERLSVMPVLVRHRHTRLFPRRR